MESINNFVHLHVHSHYSINDAISSVKQLVDKAIECGMPGIALTDHGNMYGVKELFDYVNRINKKREKNGEEPFKAILGCELYVAKNGCKEQKEGVKDFGGYHLTVLAKNLQGYRNLIKIVSNSWTDGFYVRPRTDRNELEKYHEGLIVLSGCLAGEVPVKLVNGDVDGARKTIEWYRRVFGDDYYLELERHEDTAPSAILNREVFEKQVFVNKALVEISKEYGIKLIATNDVHFMDQEDADAQDHMLCLATGKELNDFSRVRYTMQEWLKTPEEMSKLFTDIPEAIDNTMEVFNKIETYSLNHVPMLPSFPIPEDLQAKGIRNDSEYLAFLVDKGAKRIYGDALSDEITNRLDFELSVINESGYPRYFLIMQDIVNHGRNELEAVVGPGRGSVAGSLVAYCLGITKIDSLKYDLLFERFMCPGRNSIPDIDVDFDDKGRQRVVEWLKEKYGKDNSAHIVTFSRMLREKTFKEMARLEKVPKKLVDNLYNAIPSDCYYLSLKTAIQFTPELQKYEKSDIAIRNAIHNSMKLEGIVKGIGVHACGLVFSDTPISDYVPVCVEDDPYREGEKLHCTQYDGLTVESTGLVKWDFLGLIVLGQIKDACSAIKKNRGLDVDMDNLPLDDTNTFKLFQSGKTTGVFQFESKGMQQYLKYMHPTVFDDLVLLNVMYRPGLMDWIPEMIERKKGRKTIKYAIPNMERYLKETYGLVVYQEQIMLLSSLLADFNRIERDNLRKALGKRKQDVLPIMKEKFFSGGKKNGYKKSVLKEIWESWELLGCYAFNKSHAVCYTWIAYQTAYLKANYPVEYMAAIMESRKTNKPDLNMLIKECKRMGVNLVSSDLIGKDEIQIIGDEIHIGKKLMK